MRLKLMLLDRSGALVEAWGAAFSGVSDVSIHTVSFQEVLGRFDCLVSPGNSSGRMGGGFDLAVAQCFPPGLETRVKAEISRQYGGMQPVGTCLMIETGMLKCPWLAHCPTMKSPMDVSQTKNAYKAMLAALFAAERVGVRTLVCPGLCTGTGRMAPSQAAQQMRSAYDAWRSPKQES